MPFTKIKKYVEGGEKVRLDYDACSRNNKLNLGLLPAVSTLNQQHLFV
jgi:hypothetical protein